MLLFRIFPKYEFLQPKQNLPSSDPITHPLYGAAPVQNPPYNNGYADTSQPTPFNPGPPYGHHPPADAPQVLQPGGFQQPPVFNTQPLNPSYGQQQTVQAVPEKPQPVEKPPIPEEHAVIQSVFDELRARCTCAANNPVSSKIT